MLRSFWVYSSVFRDAFISVLSAATPGNLEEVSAKLDAAGNTLEYRRYAETLFEILIAGRLLGKSRAPFFIGAWGIKLGTGIHINNGDV